MAERGFHGASMSAIAKAAGVAAGTAYVHYSSKDEIIIDAYVEAKRNLWDAVSQVIDPRRSTRDRFVSMWRATYQHFRADPNIARFILQVDRSPFSHPAHAAAMADHSTSFDDLFADLKKALIDLPPMVLYDLGLAPALRMAGTGEPLSDAQITTAAGACWRAITTR